MGHGAGGSGSFLEARNLRAEDELLRGTDSFDGGEQFFADTGKLPRKIKHLNGLLVANRHIYDGISLFDWIETFVMPWGSSNRSGFVYDASPAACDGFQVDYCRGCSYR